MNSILKLKLKAPMGAFLGVKIDQFPENHFWPGKSQIVGLIGAALGIKRYEYDRLQEIQDNIDVFFVVLNESKYFVDYQIANLGADYLLALNSEKKWIRRKDDVFKLYNRTGGDSVKSSRELYIPYNHDVNIDVFIKFKNIIISEDILENAFLEPYYPLFIGRSNCFPTEQIFQGFIKNMIFEEVIDSISYGKLVIPEKNIVKNWNDVFVRISDVKDWKNNIHVGETIYIVRSFEGVN